MDSQELAALLPILERNLGPVSKRRMTRTPISKDGANYGPQGTPRRMPSADIIPRPQRPEHVPEIVEPSPSPPLRPGVLADLATQFGDVGKSFQDEIFDPLARLYRDGPWPDMMGPEKRLEAERANNFGKPPAGFDFRVGNALRPERTASTSPIIDTPVDMEGMESGPTPFGLSHTDALELNPHISGPTQVQNPAYFDETDPGYAENYPYLQEKWKDYQQWRKTGEMEGPVKRPRNTDAEIQAQVESEMTPQDMNLLKYGRAYPQGVPASAISNDPRVMNHPEVAGLQATLKALQSANAAARRGVNDVPRGSTPSTAPEGLETALSDAGMLGPRPGAHAAALRSGSSGGSAMARPISMEDDRRRQALVGLRAGQAPVPQGTGDLEARAQAAKERLVADPSRGLSMDLQGTVVGSGGTPVDEGKAMAARLARATKQAEAMATLKKNRQLDRAGLHEVPLPPGMDPTLFGMPPQYAAQLMAARENNAAAGKRADADREVTRMGVEGRNKAMQTEADAQRLRQENEGKVTTAALDPSRNRQRIVEAMPDGPQKEQALLQMLDEETRKQGAASGAPGVVQPARPTGPALPEWAVGKTPSQIMEAGLAKGFTAPELVKMIRQMKPGRLGVSEMSPGGVDIGSGIFGTLGMGNLGFAVPYLGIQALQGKLPRFPISEVNPAFDPWAWLGVPHPASQSARKAP